MTKFIKTFNIEKPIFPPFPLKFSLSMGQDTPLKTTLLEQLKNTHTQKDWFVPANIAVEGLTAEQASWRDGSGNHTIGQLAYHLVFWNERQLANFKGAQMPNLPGSNDETFDAFDQKSWADVVKRLDVVLTELEKVIRNADEPKLQKWASTIANISVHNAYHTGQIVYIRKLQGSWDASKGVK